jgi:hypothetical protein
LKDNDIQVMSIFFSCVPIWASFLAADGQVHQDRKDDKKIPTGGGDLLLQEPQIGTAIDRTVLHACVLA